MARSGFVRSRLTPRGPQHDTPRPRKLPTKVSESMASLGEFIRKFARLLPDRFAPSDRRVARPLGENANQPDGPFAPLNFVQVVASQVALTMRLGQREQPPRK